jgi:UDP-N-acetylglucosamine 2-epimerase (non-hydrolysing)
MKVAVVLGTRPEVIKLAPVIQELRRYPKHFRVMLLATAQHRRMMDQMLALFHLKPDLDLNIMRPAQSLESLTSSLMKKVSGAISSLKPDLILVQGDTTTVMITALAAFYQKIPVAHLEAGLRTGDPANPFPEEINRRIVSLLASHHFVPTPQAASNLKREGVASSSIHVTGNTVVDALLSLRPKIKKCPLPVLLSPGKRLILVTAHRRESFGRPLINICRAIKELVRMNPGVEVAYPVHPNPNVRRAALGVLKGVPRVHLLDPLDYLPFLALLRSAFLVLSDSGGLQEEAPSFKKPVLVLREVTERPEGVQEGIARIVGTDKRRIIEAAQRLLSDRRAYARMTARKNPYGDGRAAQRIRRFLIRSLAKQKM